MSGSLRDNLIDYLELCREEGRTHMTLPRSEGHKPAKPVTNHVVPEKQISIQPVPVQVQAAALHGERVGRADGLKTIATTVSACTRCPLHKGRTQTVPGQGSPTPDILFVGEGPGAEEDAQGLAFVGRSGQLLTKMIEAMGYTRDTIFIANIVKCRPPDNRAPLPEEMDSCMPYLLEQIRILKPKIIVALGATSVKGLIKSETGITKLRGTWQTFDGIPLMPTYHPAYLLRNPPAKKDVWEDLKAVLKRLGKIPPPIRPTNN